LARGNRSKPSGERTDEERERDRQARAQRRAGEVAEPPQDPPAVEATSPEVPVEEPAETPPEPIPAGEVPEVLPEPVPVEQPAQAPPIPPPSPSEPPRPARRDALLEQRRDRLRAGRGRGGRSRLTRTRVAALLALIVAIVVVWFLLSLFQPFAGAGHGRVIVVIPKDSSASKVGSILSDDGVVSSGFFFDMRALVEGKRGELHSGRFLLEHDESYAAAIAALSKPPPVTIPVKVVIPEGETRLQIAQLAAEDGLTGSYTAASEHSPLLDPVTYGAPRSTQNLEGFLFPATYDMKAGASVSRLVSEQLTAFRERFGAEEVRRARELHVTPYQLLTVASMVEREAQLPGDRPKIAAVIYNRLRVGMPLGIDATIYYAVEQALGIATDTHELTEAQLHIDSPYNTRTHRGLPPTPISNPGMASIEAAAHPAHVPYLYYVAGADGCGEQVFSTSYAQFETDAAAYDAAVKKNGGKPPECKKK
jgi:peptidoglycan lytic transglycosylase G